MAPKNPLDDIVLAAAVLIVTSVWTIAVVTNWQLATWP